MRRYLALALSFLMVSGCALNRSVERTEGPVTVSVNPKIDLISAVREVISIYLQVKNNSNRTLSLRRSDIMIELPDDSRISPHEAKEIRDIQKRQPQRADSTGWLVATILFPPTIVVIALYALLVSPVALAKYAHETSQETPLNDDFKDVRLNKDDSAKGFVFSMLPPQFLWKSKLVLRFVDETDGSSFVVRVPVSEQ